MKEKLIKILSQFSRIVVGLCFIFSGFVKSVDPYGTAYKIEDYFEAFSLASFSNFSLFFSICLSSFEFLLGSMVLFNLKKRLSVFLSLIFISVMTLITAVIYITNPISDCGCFGDAVILSNSQTFYKNVVLLALIFLMYYGRRYSYKIYGESTKNWALIWCLLFPLLISFHAIVHIPLIDFRPYKIGNSIPSMMKFSSEDGVNKYKSVFTYEKNGKMKKFDEENIPYRDTSWHYVNRKDILVSKGSLPPIHDFNIIHPVYGDITMKVLSDTSYVFLAVYPKITVSGLFHCNKINYLIDFTHKNGYKIYGLTSSNKQDVDEWKFENNVSLDFCTADERALKTIIRSGVGYILIKNGVVINKWSCNDLPRFKRPGSPYKDFSLGLTKHISGINMLFILTMVYLLPLMFIFAFRGGYILKQFIYKRRKLKLK